MAKFDLKTFNPEVFASYSRTIEDPVKARLIQAGVFYGDPDLASRFPDQVGGNYATRPMIGLLAGDPVSYDGSTTITDGTLNTYTQGIGVNGWAKSFTERDFTSSISGKDFKVVVAEQIAKYWAHFNQKVLLSTLKGIFGSALSANSRTADSVSASQINDVCREVAGDNADMFAVIFMHSAIAKEYEALQILEYAKYNAEDGMMKPSQIGYINGKLVIVDDSCPVVENKSEGVVVSHSYTCYILGQKAFCYQELPVEVPFEMARDAKTHGGETSLVSRERFILAPEGVSLKSTAYSGKTSLSLSDLETASNWELVSDGTNAIELKTVPFASLVITL